MRLSSQRRRAQGFTLIELVVAALISLLIMAGLYVVYAGHSTVFRGQEAVSEAQVAARFAMDTVKEDLRRTGFMAVADTDASYFEQQRCGPPAPLARFVAIEHTQGDGDAEPASQQQSPPGDRGVGPLLARRAGGIVGHLVGLCRGQLGHTYRASGVPPWRGSSKRSCKS